MNILIELKVARTEARPVLAEMEARALIYRQDEKKKKKKKIHEKKKKRTEVFKTNTLKK